jgi:integrase/recombinase XerD
MTRVVAEYVAALEARGTSVSLRRSSRRVLGHLVAYLGEAYSIEDWRAVSDVHLRGFVVYLSERYRTATGATLSPDSVRQSVSRVRSFFRWMRATGRLIADPSERVALPKKGRHLPRVLSEDDVARLVEAPDTRTAIGLRNRALLEVLYATGLRHAEAHAIDLHDVDLGHDRLVVREGKGRRDRVVPLTETAVAWLRRYLRTARPELVAGPTRGRGGRLRRPPSPTSALWVTTAGRRLSYVMIWQLVHTYAAAVGVSATVHTFRHSCATHLLRGGANVREVQALLGHARLDTTALYTHLDVDDLARAVERALADDPSDD